MSRITKSVGAALATLALSAGAAVAAAPAASAEGTMWDSYLVGPYPTLEDCQAVQQSYIRSSWSVPGRCYYFRTTYNSPPVQGYAFNYYVWDYDGTN